MEGKDGMQGRKGCEEGSNVRKDGNKLKIGM
jgi:hypothetical protein